MNYSETKILNNVSDCELGRMSGDYPTDNSYKEEGYMIIQVIPKTYQMGSNGLECNEYMILLGRNEIAKDLYGEN